MAHSLRALREGACRLTRRLLLEEPPRGSVKGYLLFSCFWFVGALFTWLFGGNESTSLMLLVPVFAFVFAVLADLAYGRHKVLAVALRMSGFLVMFAFLALAIRGAL